MMVFRVLCVIMCYIISTYRAMVNIKSVTPPVQHGEGPLWEVKTQHLFFVDTFKATVYRLNPKSDSLSSYTLDKHNSIAIIIPIKGKKDEYVVGADRHLYKFRWSTENCTKTELSELIQIEKDKPSNQFNDGKADSRGRIWLGTLTRNPDLSVESYGGSLFSISGANVKKVDEKIKNTSISNGLDWSLDNKKMYYIDSETRTVVVYDYEERSGNISNKKVILNLANHPEIKGIPDGMTIDNIGNLWVALFGGHSVINVNPKTGEIIRTVELPATYVTSACFGGPNLDVLYVTTSRLHLDEEGLREEPLAGSVFSVENLGVKGKPAYEAVLN